MAQYTAQQRAAMDALIRGSHSAVNNTAAIAQMNAELARAPTTRYAVDVNGQRVDPVSAYAPSPQPGSPALAAATEVATASPGRPVAASGSTPGLVRVSSPMRPRPTLVDTVGERFGQTPLGGFIKQNLPDLFYGFGEGLKGRSPMRAARPMTPAQMKDPRGFAIGEANRRNPNPTYNVVGDNNAFQPQSVQNSTRWQTGY